MTSSSAADQGGLWAGLPEELLLMVLEQLGWARRESVAVRLTSSRWRRLHDEGCKTNELRWGATDEAVVALSGRLPALTKLDLHGPKSSLIETRLQSSQPLRAVRLHVRIRTRALYLIATPTSAAASPPSRVSPFRQAAGRAQPSPEEAAGAARAS